MFYELLYFDQVMMRLFSPRKTTLMFVIRDKTRVGAPSLSSVFLPFLVSMGPVRKYLSRSFFHFDL